MNILFICDEFPPGKTGGIGIAVNMLAKQLSAKGHGVFIAGLCVHGYGAADYEELENIRIWRLRYASDFGIISSKDNLIDKVLVHSLRAIGILRIDAKKQFRKLMNLVQEIVVRHQIDVIEMPDWNNFFFNLHPADFVMPNFSVPLVVKMHGSFNYFRSLDNKPVNVRFFELEEILYKRGDAVVAVSAFTAEYGKKLYHLNQTVAILYNGVQLDVYAGADKRENKKKVVFCGSLLKKKGIYSLVQSWAAVLAKHPTASLHIYGKGDQQKVKHFISDVTKESIHFYGHIPRNEMMSVLRSADLAVFPSFSETFGMAAAEAMSTGCPVVFTKLTSGPEIITEGQEGWLIDPAYPEQISNAIIDALGSGDKRASFGKAGYEKVREKFEIDQVIQLHLDYYQDLIIDFRKRGS